MKRQSALLQSFIANRKLKREHLVYAVIVVAIMVFSAAQLANISPLNTHKSLQYYRAEVLVVEKSNNASGISQNIKAELMDGPSSGKDIWVERTANFGDASYNRIPIGSDILLSKSTNNGNQYLFSDRWRIPGVITLFLILLFLIILVGWWRGLTSIVGLVISIGVLSVYAVPSILAGHSVYATCVISAFIITLVSFYIAHGFSKRTSIALAGSLATLLAVIGLVALATYLAGTSEVITEDTVGALNNGNIAISLSGLFTGGIIIASLGALYDITTGQAAAVDEVYKSNKKQPPIQLYKRGLSVGREHIAALVNTLALVYVGIALPSIVTAVIYNSGAPVIVAINNEIVVEEIVRTFVASVGMLLAVPITTGLAAYILPKWYKQNSSNPFKKVVNRLSN